MNDKEPFDFSNFDFEKPQENISDEDFTVRRQKLADNLKKYGHHKEEDKWLETASIVNMAVYYIAGFIGLILLVSIFIKGFVWFDDNAKPLINGILTILFYLILPASLILSIFKRVRGFGGIGVLVSSSLLIFNVWVWSLEIAYILAGKIWLIVGILFAGVGVIPIALVAAAISSQWLFVFSIVATLIIAWVVRIFSFFVLSKSK